MTCFSEGQGEVLGWRAHSPENHGGGAGAAGWLGRGRRRGEGEVVGKACCGEGRLCVSVAISGETGGVFDKANW